MAIRLTDKQKRARLLNQDPSTVPTSQRDNLLLGAVEQGGNVGESIQRILGDNSQSSVLRGIFQNFITPGLNLQGPSGGKTGSGVLGQNESLFLDPSRITNPGGVPNSLLRNQFSSGVNSFLPEISQELKQRLGSFFISNFLSTKGATRSNTPGLIDVKVSPRALSQAAGGFSNLPQFVPDTFRSLGFNVPNPGGGGQAQSSTPLSAFNVSSLSGDQAVARRSLTEGLGASRLNEGVPQDLQQRVRQAFRGFFQGRAPQSLLSKVRIS